MARDNWQGREDAVHPRPDPREREDFGQADYSADYGYDPQRRTGFRTHEDAPSRIDYGQADYSDDFAYDAQRRQAYRRFSENDPGRPGPAPRSWMARAGDFVGASGKPADPRPQRRGPSDRVLWAVIVERLEDERHLDLRDVEVTVLDGEVTLNGTVRRKDDRRRIEDVSDIEGVRHVQNNLRVRDRGWF